MGRSEGARVKFHCDALDTDYEVFTTRPDTLWGATFFVMAPEHPDVLKLSDSAEVADYARRALTESAEERRGRGQGEDGSGAREHRDQPRQRASRSRCSLPTTC
ncbi:MAG: hypothetical protein WKF40_10135 [Thermoleophilaceae bacterium]